MMKKIKNYLTGVIEELGKVTIPDKKTTKEMTTLVIVLSLAISLYVSFLDFGFSNFTKWLINN
jgi:preprotein translocase SecE subunit